MYYTLYAFLTIIIIIIDIIIIIIITIIIIVVVVVVISQLRQAAIIKRALIGLSYVARANHRPRERHTRWEEEASSPFLSSRVLDISSFAPTKKP